MKSTTPIPTTVDAYIREFPKEVQTRLRKLRALIKKVAPHAEERISYRMPGYTQNGPLIYFAGYAHHIGLYPLPKAVTAFEKDLAPYVTAKGSVQFPFDKPLPYDLIEKIVRFRLAENGDPKDAGSAPKRGTKVRARSGPKAAGRRSKG